MTGPAESLFTPDAPASKRARVCGGTLVIYLVALLVCFGMLHLTNLSTTIYMHRGLSHKGIPTSHCCWSLEPHKKTGITLDRTIVKYRLTSK